VLSPEERAEVEALRGEAARLATEIDDAAESDARYTGGLIKGLIGVRLEVLKTTKSLVDQRIQAIEAGSPVTVVTKVATADEAKASALAAEIVRAEADLAEARRDADRYSGGLVAAMKGVTVATQEQTLSMLRQQFVFAKYGLTYPVADPPARGAPFSAPPAATNTEAPAPRVTPVEREDSSFQIVDISTRVTESNSTWWKYAWKLTLRNYSEQTLQLDAHIEFLDEDGFVVDDARESSLILRAGEEKTFTGYELIDAAVAPNVQRVNAKVNRG
jgi:hypothetical protein